MRLNTEPNLPAPDEFYEALIDMHRDLTAEQSQEANAALVLLLCNHIGDGEALGQAMALARASVARAAQAGSAKASAISARSH